jgi:hypothetical protein
LHQPRFASCRGAKAAPHGFAWPCPWRRMVARMRQRKRCHRAILRPGAPPSSS